RLDVGDVSRPVDVVVAPAREDAVLVVAEEVRRARQRPLAVEGSALVRQPQVHGAAGPENTLELEQGGEGGPRGARARGWRSRSRGTSRRTGRGPRRWRGRPREPAPRWPAPGTLSAAPRREAIHVADSGVPVQPPAGGSGPRSRCRPHAAR